MSATTKRCSRCKAVLPLLDFADDRTRPDGKSYVCRDCKSTRTIDGPTIVERNRMAALNMSWCSGCTAWLPAVAVSRGKCRQCARRYERERFANDPVYREERRRHAKLRRRGVEPVPAIGREYLTEKFAGRCAYCQLPAQTWDHIEPVVRGGLTVPENIVPACNSCNSSKKDSDVYEFIFRAKNPHPQLLEVLSSRGDS